MSLGWSFRFLDVFLLHSGQRVLVDVLERYYLENQGNQNVSRHPETFG